MKDDEVADIKAGNSEGNRKKKRDKIKMEEGGWKR